MRFLTSFLLLGLLCAGAFAADINLYFCNLIPNNQQYHVQTIVNNINYMSDYVGYQQCVTMGLGSDVNVISPYLSLHAKNSAGEHVTLFNGTYQFLSQSSQNLVFAIPESASSDAVMLTSPRLPVGDVPSYGFRTLVAHYGHGVTDEINFFLGIPDRLEQTQFNPVGLPYGEAVGADFLLNPEGPIDTDGQIEANVTQGATDLTYEGSFRTEIGAEIARRTWNIKTQGYGGSTLVVALTGKQGTTDYPLTVFAVNTMDIASASNPGGDKGGASAAAFGGSAQWTWLAVAASLLSLLLKA